jgi:hypothetical protein
MKVSRVPLSQRCEQDGKRNEQHDDKLHSVQMEAPATVEGVSARVPNLQGE